MNRCLVVTDFQNDFVDGALGFPGAELLEEPICKKIREYRESGGEVVFTFDTHYGDYLDTQEGRNLPVAHCIEGSKGHGLYGKVACEVKDSDRKFMKNCFGSAGLFEYLKTKRFESIELVGLVSNICVLSNAVLAKTAQPEAKIIVDRACTASFDSKLGEAALEVMAGLQIQIAGRTQCN